MHRLKVQCGHAAHTWHLAYTELDITVHGKKLKNRI